MMKLQKRPVALIIIDGWGIAAPSKGNAACAARTPFIDDLMKKWPVTQIKASGTDVGLPAGQMGNSEVGHTNIGAGRVVYQDLLRISNEVEDGSFYNNKVLLDAMRVASHGDKTLHLAGLLSDGGVHSHLTHLEALLRMAKREGVKNVAIHAFFDGRDTSPTGGYAYMEQLLDSMREIGIGKIASLSGRYYAMDRDNRWDRVEKAYRALTAVNFEGKTSRDPLETIRTSYDLGVTDEFIVPVVMVDDDGSAVAPVKPGDAFIFFNFRPDRARELTRAFCEPSFDKFPTEYVPMGLHYVTFTEYSADFDHFPDLFVAWPPLELTGTFGEVISKAGLRQLRIAETEKYAHVTFFFNGGREISYEGEERILVPSPSVPTYDLKPEMSAYVVTDRLLEALSNDHLDVIILNYANGDMVGHTGVFEAAVKAIEAVDHCLSRAVPAIVDRGGVALITADHGNCEAMIDPITNETFTAHTTNPVWLIGAGLSGGHLEKGRLADLAPTLLDIIGLPKSDEMTGHSLWVRDEA